MVIAAVGLVDLYFLGGALKDESPASPSIVVNFEQFFSDIVFRVEICSACFDCAVHSDFLANYADASDWIGSR